MSTSQLRGSATAAPALDCMAYVRTHLLPPPKAKWSVADIPDLSGKVMIVTGGNAGIGRETVKVQRCFPTIAVAMLWLIDILRSVGVAQAQREGIHGL